MKIKGDSSHNFRKLISSQYLGIENIKERG